jgi:hypothetical protein
MVNANKVDEHSESCDDDCVDIHGDVCEGWGR